MKSASPPDAEAGEWPSPAQLQGTARPSRLFSDGSPPRRALLCYVTTHKARSRVFYLKLPRLGIIGIGFRAGLAEKKGSLATMKGHSGPSDSTGRNGLVVASFGFVFFDFAFVFNNFLASFRHLTSFFCILGRPRSSQREIAQRQLPGVSHIAVFLGSPLNRPRADDHNARLPQHFADVKPKVQRLRAVSAPVPGPWPRAPAFMALPSRGRRFPGCRHRGRPRGSHPARDRTRLQRHPKRVGSPSG